MEALPDSFNRPSGQSGYKTKEVKPKFFAVLGVIGKSLTAPGSKKAGIKYFKNI